MVGIGRQCGIDGIGGGRGSGGSDCAWVDYVQSPSPTDWLTITYGYDSAGRRIEKAYDGQTVIKYFYDGSHIIAEYDGSGSLRMKSEARNTKSETNSKHESTKTETRPLGTGLAWDFGFWSLGFVSSFDIRISDLTPYYSHFDGLGSVVALTNSAGSVVNLYEYSVYGQVAASDPNHPNRFLFTGREFDKDTGLYYYRARYYNPYLARFLQTDPASQGVNWYAYCGNSPTGATDPSGMAASDFGFSMYREYLPNGVLYRSALQFNWKDGTECHSLLFWRGISGWIDWAIGGGKYEDESGEIDPETGKIKVYSLFGPGWEKGQPGWLLSTGGYGEKGTVWHFWEIKALMWLDKGFAGHMTAIEGKMLDPKEKERLGFGTGFNDYIYSPNTVWWDKEGTQLGGPTIHWHTIHPIVMLANVLEQAYLDIVNGVNKGARSSFRIDQAAVKMENSVRYSLFQVDPANPLWPRTGIGLGNPDVAGATDAATAWQIWRSPGYGWIAP
jgi:RHS repeat-associated protein